MCLHDVIYGVCGGEMPQRQHWVERAPVVGELPCNTELVRRVLHVKKGRTKLPNSCGSFGELDLHVLLYQQRRRTINPSHSSWRVMYSKLIDRGAVEGEILSCNAQAIQTVSETLRL